MSANEVRNQKEADTVMTTTDLHCSLTYNCMCNMLFDILFPRCFIGKLLSSTTKWKLWCRWCHIILGVFSPSMFYICKVGLGRGLPLCEIVRKGLSYYVFLKHVEQLLLCETNIQTRTRTHTYTHNPHVFNYIDTQSSIWRPSSPFPLTKKLYRQVTSYTPHDKHAEKFWQSKERKKKKGRKEKNVEHQGENTYLRLPPPGGVHGHVHCTENVADAHAWTRLWSAPMCN